MSILFSAPHLFALGYYAAIVMFIQLVIFKIIRHKKGVASSSIGLCVAIGLVVSTLLLGDWKIPDCYDTDGKLLSQLPQCRF